MIRWIAAIALAGSVVVAAPIASAAPADNAPGTVVDVSDLPAALWFPSTGSAKRVTYWSVGSDGRPALSSGAFYLPEGTPPAGGWPVIGWAHGTSGLADDCAPSRVGPALAGRDRPYLGNWLARGYAITASDYVGLGTPGVHPYLDSKVEAHSVVDMVKAARAVTPTLSNRWVAIGQSQGGGAAVATAAHASEYGGPALDFRGAVGTGVPAYIEDTLLPLGPGVPPVALPAGITSYVFDILAGFRAAHPELNVNSYLTPLGRKYVDLAETLCTNETEDVVRGVVLGDAVNKPLRDVPNFQATLTDYMALPETGYNRPLFIGQGLTDTDVPAPLATAFAARLAANGQPVTFKTYPTDHSGTFVQSQADAIPFVERLFGK
ncbi:lipase [Antrihabitans cavernicola]|uniref:Lipase n=1 Tax=Antrihabitans cavernicola TaxID=2495913 RepID=A0A5A7S8X0_9NOCA|nr:lipase family protein [Spelaeibacter cavernicola]KAA0020226.1 lipase [Spelaeibacter cavernicola]